MPGSAHTTYTMAGLCVAGGLMGYTKAKSLPSLIAGAALGGMFALSGFLITSGQDENGHLLSTLSSAALTGAMGSRFYKTRALMPAGIMAGVGAAHTLYQGKKYYEWSDFSNEKD